MDRTVSAAVYNLLIGLTLGWGFLVNWLMVVSIDAESIRSVHPLLFIIGYIACCAAGVRLFTRSTDPLMSFLGYNLVVLPLGFVVNLLVSPHDATLVQDAIRVTGLVTLAMLALGTLFPRFFEEIANVLTMALALALLLEFVEIAFFGIHHGIIDLIMVVIFCGYIGLDWGRANRIPRTLNNALDSAASLYMDVINLFVRFVRLLGGK